jgi:hypothetical protein
LLHLVRGAGLVRLADAADGSLNSEWGTRTLPPLKGLADISFDGDKVHLPHVLFQPMAADDVAAAVGRIAVGLPVNGIVEIGGPEQFRMDELVQRRLATLKDPREVIADPNARYSGAKITEENTCSRQ